jgi:hypothetical protein
MQNFAIVEGGEIVNLVIAESIEVAEEISGKSAIEFNIDEIRPLIGWSVVDGVIVDEDPLPIPYVEEPVEEPVEE